MKRASFTSGWVWGLAVGFGAAVAVVVVGGAVSAPPTAAQEASLTLTVTPSGELAVSPTEVVLPLIPPDVGASFSVFNQTSKSMDVTIAALDDLNPLTEEIEVLVAVADLTVFRGSLAQLVNGSSPFELDTGESKTVTVKFTVSDSECPYCTISVALQFHTAAIGP